MIVHKAFKGLDEMNTWMLHHSVTKSDIVSISHEYVEKMIGVYMKYHLLYYVEELISIKDQS